MNAGKLSALRIGTRSSKLALWQAEHVAGLIGVVARCRLGYSALAVTDRGTLAGMVRAHTAAKDAGLKLIVGAELWPVDAPPLVLWATDRPSYGRLCRLIIRGARHHYTLRLAHSPEMKRHQNKKSGGNNGCVNGKENR